MKDIFVTDYMNPDFQKAFRLYFDELDVKVDDWEEVFRQMSSTSSYIRFTDDGSIVGFILFEPITLSNWFFIASYGFVREFWVAEKYRGKGNGTALLRHTEKYFKENGLHRVILTTDSAPQFYEKNGYIKEKSVIAKNNDEVFVKDLV